MSNERDRLIHLIRTLPIQQGKPAPDQADTVRPTVQALKIYLEQRGVDPGIMASLFAQASLEAYGNERTDQARGLRAMAGVMQQMPTGDRAVDLAEITTLLQTITPRVDRYADLTGAELGETEDFDGLFTADNDCPDDFDVTIESWCGSASRPTDIAQLLIAEGERILVDELGNHRAAQYLLKALGYQIAYIADPESAATFLSYRLKLMELDAEREQEKGDDSSEVSVASKDDKNDSDLRGDLVDTFSMTLQGLEHLDIPIDQASEVTETPVSILSTSTYRTAPILEMLRNVLWDDLAACWFLFFVKIGWNVTYTRTSLDPRVPDFVAAPPDAISEGSRQTRIFLVEDRFTFLENPDDRGAVQRFGVTYRQISPGPVLLLGHEPILFAEPEERISECVLGWYLSAEHSQENSLPHKDNRQWRVAFLNATASDSTPYLCTAGYSPEEGMPSGMTIASVIADQLADAWSDAVEESHEAGFSDFTGRHLDRLLWQIRRSESG